MNTTDCPKDQNSETASDAPAEKRDTRFQKGASGNAKGRRKGIPNFTTQLKAELGADPVSFVIRALKVAAEKGDTTALRTLADRVWPAQRATLPPADVAPPDDTLRGQGAAVIEAMLTGQIAADVGAQMLAGLQNQARLIETEELAERVAALEAAITQQPR